MNVIAIPSRSRAEKLLKSQGTFSYIDQSKHSIYLVVRECELEEYQESAWAKGLEIVTVPDEFRLPDKRQFFMEFAQNLFIEKVLWLDDDLQFYPHDANFASNYAIDGRPKKSILDEMGDQLFAISSEKFPMAGILFRQGAQNNTRAFHWNKKIFQVWVLHVPTFFKVGIDIRKAPGRVVEDFYTTILFRKAGYLVPTLGSFCCSDAGRTPGGCQDYRSMQVQSDACVELAEMFPESCKVRLVKANTYWAEDRKDISINYAVYNEGKVLPTKQQMLKHMAKNGYVGNLKMKPTT